MALSPNHGGADSQWTPSSDTQFARPFCAREVAIIERENMKPVPEFLATCQVMTFDLGYSLQDKVTQTLAAADLAWGNWKCRNCGTVHEFRKMPRQCGTGTCLSTRFDYEEVRALSSFSGIGSGLDLIVDVGKPKFRFIEVKTMAADKFKALVAPLGEHKLRTNLSLRNIDEWDNKHSDLINTQEADVMYISKSAWGCGRAEIKEWDFRDSAFSPFKVFPIARDDSLTEDYVQEARKAHLAVVNPEKPLPPRICPTSFCDRAGKCNAVHKCFGSGLNLSKK